MVLTTLILGLLGSLLFFLILGSFQSLLKKNESGFLHLLMAIMYLCYLPIPITLFFIIKADYYLIGMIFGIFSLFLLIIAMILQASHLVYSANHYEEDKDYWSKQDQWMMNGLLGNLIELLADLLKGIWIICLTIYFWMEQDLLYGIMGIVFSLTVVVYFLMLLNHSLIKEIKILKKIRFNFIIINFETFIWFTLMIIYIFLHK